MKNTAIVLAGGTGSRMHSDIPKQYMNIGGKPVLYYSLKVFEDCEQIDDIILVTRAEDIAFCRQHIIEKYELSKVSRIAEGGKERHESVYKGLMAATDTDLVLIHDGARPCLDGTTLSHLISDAVQYGNAVAAVPAKDTVRIVDENGDVTNTPDRRRVWNMQTPQIFQRKSLLEAYAGYEADLMPPAITDDAMLVERYTRIRIHLSMGSYDNLKITTPGDLLVAQQICCPK